MAAIYLGTQGWNYDGWSGPFYPRGTPNPERLSLYAKIFDSVEVDSTFYAVPAETAVRGWSARTPDHFKFSVKLISEITHKNRLLDSQEALTRFVERLRILGPKLACVLIQMPPDFSPSERKSLSSFLRILPKDMNFAIEFRDSSWLTDDVIDELRERGVALTLADSRWINRELSLKLAHQPTATFTYVRWLGLRDLTDYSHIQINRDRELKQWAEAFRSLRETNQTVYGYFNNHFQGHSPASCNLFKSMVGIPTSSPDILITQPSLF